MESNKSSIYNRPDSKSMWVLIVNDIVMFKCEFPHVVSDEEVAVCHNNADLLLEELGLIDCEDCDDEE